MSWNKDNPAAGIAAKTLDDHIRTNQTALETAIDNEHDFTTGGTQTGDHTQGSARCFCQDAEPTTRIDGTAFGATDLGSMWVDTNSSPDNQFNILTALPHTWTPISDEVIAVAVAAIHTWAAIQTFAEAPVFTKGIVANDSYLQGRNAADGANIDIVKVNSSNGLTLGAVATIPDTSALATSGAPAADAQIANKKYVDDQIDTVDIGNYGDVTTLTAAVAATETDESGWGSTLAATNLLVFATCTNDGTGDVKAVFRGYTGATSSPTTLRGVASIGSLYVGSPEIGNSFTMVVKKGEYYKITGQSKNGYGTPITRTYQAVTIGT